MGRNSHTSIFTVLFISYQVIFIALFNLGSFKVTSILMILFANLAYIANKKLLKLFGTLSFVGIGTILVLSHQLSGIDLSILFVLAFILFSFIYKNILLGIIGTILSFILHFVLLRSETSFKLVLLLDYMNMVTLILFNITLKRQKAKIQTDLFLPNVQYAYQTLNELIHSSNQFAVAVIDLDQLKFINQKEGYDAGDYVIVQVIKRIKAHLHSSHTFVRSGGDEFTILFNHVNSKKACLKILNLILQDLRKAFSYQQQKLYISASIGLVTYTDKFSSVDEYLRAAKISLEKAKNNGRNRICLFDNLRDDSKIRQFKLEKDLKSALSQGELELYYQPILRLKDRRDIGFESLVRWNHPDLGMISPVEFIPMAERTGLIIDIGHYVIYESCRMLHFISNKVNVEYSMNINISPKQLKDEFLYELIKETIIEFNLKPEQIHLEITESALIDDLEHSRIILKLLVDLGVKIHLDDFGTGYSSLSYLHSLPIDCIKIDKTFVDNIGNESPNDQLLKSIIYMGEVLKMNVIAEGIEDIHRYNRLMELGCEYGQGYYFSRPLKSKDLVLYLENKLIFD